MSQNSSYDSYETFKKLSEHWEKQANDIIHLWTNNKEFVKFTNVNSHSYARYLNLFKKNQELLATQLNLPTKDDLANVSKITLQTEEKLDALEEQIWSLSDSFNETNKEIESVVEISREVVKITKQLKSELSKTKKELSNTKVLEKELKEVKEEIANMSGMKEELALLRTLLQETNLIEEDKKELALVGEPNQN
jgi:tRNA U34 5-carboxymethylaminomethyl modifying GTPase MnmE/TrmE